MFTGIIEGLGTVSAIASSGPGKRLAIESDFALDQTKIGDSLSVSGACLTVVKLQVKRFEVDVSPETLTKTTFGKVKMGDRVNLERALRLSDRLDGHLVSGHIDGLGTLQHRERIGNAILVTIGASKAITRYMIAKGSVAVDGISLTINSSSDNEFGVSVIPHTAKITTIGIKRIGDPVNIEIDMIGKYVERFLNQPGSGKSQAMSGNSGIDMDYLAKTGFL